MHTNSKRLGYLLFALTLTIPAGAPAWEPEETVPMRELPPRITVQVVKSLENYLSLVEKRAGECPGVEPRTIQNVTLPLQNYLEDVVLASGEYVEIYPILLRDIICEEHLRGASKKEIAMLLLSYQKKKEYREMWRESQSHGGGSVDPDR